MNTLSLEVSGLCKNFGERIALSDVSVCARPGEIVGVLGPNAAGKTTLVEILTGFRHADSGLLRVLGAQPGAVQTRGAVGALLQRHALPRYLRVRELLELYAALFPQAPAAQHRLEALGLIDTLGRHVRELSPGQQQRLAALIAFYGNPQLVFLDEPSSGLDPVARRALWNFILDPSLRKSRTVVLTTHQMDEAEALCDRIYFLKAGEIRGEGSPSELLRRFESRSVVEFGAPGCSLQQLLQCFGAGASIELREGRVTARVASSELVHALVELRTAGVEPLDLRVRQSSFEDVYLSVMG